ncbi:MAG: hypothetical protein IJ313_00725, partial [Clostridia bacterium]|nr:hypothetical protein [Clostridia bacterium]
ENTKLDIVESTCAVKGTKKVICKDCDETISTEELPLTECAIYIDGVCKVCGKTEETEECAHENTKLDIVESTCAVKGTKKVICKDCDETISTEELPLTECAIYIDGVCRVCGAEEPVECEHNYEIVNEEAATCTVPGYVWTKCTVCGDEQNGETAVDADNHVNTKVHIVEATCAVTGTCTTICKDCDKELSMEILPLTDCAVFVDGVCRVCGAVEAPCAHENTKVDIVEATCAVTGTKKVICKDCDEVVSEEVLPLTDCVIYIDGVCRVCGAVEAPCAHENTKFDIIEATCAKEGIEKVICKDCDEVISETVLPLTDCAIFVDGVCKLCGAVENTECEHNYETVKELAPNCTEAGYVWQECTICGAEKNFEVGEPNGEHNYATVKELAPNCVEAGYVWTACTICGAEKNYEVGEPNGEHTYEIVKELAPTCVEAGYVWEVCSVCGAEHNHEVGEATGEHTYEIVNELAPTCVEAGYVWEVCSVCGAEHNHEVGEATGEHTYETVVDLAPTCTTPGEQHDVCTVCGAETEAEMIPATDHQDIELAYDEDDHWIYCDDCDEVLASEGHEFTYWTANGYKHAACDCGYETSWKVQTGELDGLPKTGDR